MLTKLGNLIFGYDISFVYAGNQYAQYIETLANHLSNEDLRCFVEQIDDNESENHAIQKSIKSSTLLVVLASEEAGHAGYIENTIEYFNKVKKSVIAIDIGNLESAKWFYLLKNQKIVSEKATFIDNGKVSNTVFDIVNNASRFRVKNKLLKKSNLISASLLVLSIVAILGASYYIYYLSNELKKNRQLVLESQQLVAREQEKANLAVEDAAVKQKYAAYHERISQANHLAANSNSELLIDPTKAMRLAKAAYNVLDLQNDTLPKSVLISMFNAFYGTYSNKLAFYARIYDLHDPINDFYYISHAKKFLVANEDGKIRIVTSEGGVENTFDIHGDEVNTVTYSPKNQYILTTSSDNTAKLLTINGDVIKSLPGHDDIIIAGIISPNEDRLVTITDDSLRLWTKGGQLVNAIGDDVAFINDVKFSPVEEKIAVAMGKKINLLNWQGQITSQFEGHSDDVIQIAYSINGSRIVSASYDSTAIIWNKNGQLVKKLIGHNGIVNKAIFSPDRKKVLTVSDDQTAKLWTWDGQFLKTMARHSQGVVEASFSPNSNYILTISLDNTVNVWDYNGNFICTLKSHKGMITKAAFSPDNSQIYTSSKDGTLKVWNVDQNLIPTLNLHALGVKMAVPIEDGQQVLTVSGRGLVRVWDLNGKLISENLIKGKVMDMSQVDKSNFIGIIDGMVKGFNSSGKITKEYQGFGNDNERLSISQNGLLLATQKTDKSLYLLNPEGQVTQVLADSSLRIHDFQFNFNNDLVLGTNRGLGRIQQKQIEWIGFANRNILKIIPQPEVKANLLIVDNGRMLRTDELFKTTAIFPRQFNEITAAFMDNNQSLVFAGTARGKILVFDNSTQLISELNLHNGNINYLEITADKKFIITSSEDNTAKICPLLPGIDAWANNASLASFEGIK